MLLIMILIIMPIMLTTNNFTANNNDNNNNNNDNFSNNKCSSSKTNNIKNIDKSNDTMNVSLIVPRNSNLNNKANEVNSRLIHMCTERNFPYINHTNSIMPENHLNESKLHFNRYRTIAFANSMSKFLSEYY